jgi:hypothetical protein
VPRRYQRLSFEIKSQSMTIWGSQRTATLLRHRMRFRSGCGPAELGGNKRGRVMTARRNRPKPVAPLTCVYSRSPSQQIVADGQELAAIFAGDRISERALGELHPAGYLERLNSIQEPQLCSGFCQCVYNGGQLARSVTAAFLSMVLCATVIFATAHPLTG